MLILCAGLGALVTLAAWIIATLFGVVAGAKSLNNQAYHYPMTYTFVR